MTNQDNPTTDSQQVTFTWTEIRTPAQQLQEERGREFFRQWLTYMKTISAQPVVLTSTHDTPTNTLYKEIVATALKPKKNKPYYRQNQRW